MLEHTPNYSEIDLANIEPLLAGLADRVVERLTATAPMESMTFGELYLRYYEAHISIRCSESEQRNAQYFYKKHGGRWKETPVHAITRRDVQSWADEVSVTAPAAATRAVNAMQRTINWGLRRELIPPITNPCKGIDKQPDKQRDRFARPEELRRLEESMKQESPVIRDFFWIVLETGARRGNVSSMRWDEIDFDTRTWTIPASKTKNGETHVAPLTGNALSILRRRLQSRRPGSIWVFPGKFGDAHPIKDVRRAWERIKKRAEVADLTIHDLRRTNASYMAMNGANQFTIAGMLGHKDLRSTAIYARLDVSAVRREAEAVSEKFQDITAIPLQLADTTPTAKRIALTPPALNVDSGKRLTPAKQAVVEGKIISAMLAGAYCKKHFYRKLGSQFALDSFELNRVLNEMTQRGLILCFQDDLGKRKYTLPSEVSC